jgi:putative membrane protein
MGWGMSWCMGFNGVFWFIIFGLIIWLMVLGVSTLAENNQNFHTNRRKKESALEILKKRYASGEFNREEFKQRKSDLTSSYPVGD